MLWSQRRNSGAHGAENLIQISALAVVGPRTLASRLPRTPPFSRLLRHAGGYSRTILTPNLQGLAVNCQLKFWLLSSFQHNRERCPLKNGIISIRRQQYRL